MELVEMGANFTKGPKGDLHLTREGGHSHRRVVHAADLTGKEVERALLAAAHSHPSIAILEHHLAVDLVCDRVAGAKHCLGLDVLDTRSYQMQRLVAPVTMLASGGAGEPCSSSTEKKELRRISHSWGHWHLWNLASGCLPWAKSQGKHPLARYHCMTCTAELRCGDVELPAWNCKILTFIQNPLISDNIELCRWS